MIFSIEKERQGITLEDDYYALWLYGIKGIPAAAAVKMLTAFGSAKAVWSAEPAELCRAAGLRPAAEGLLAAARRGFDAEKEAGALKKDGFSYISYLNTLYPRLLKEIKNPPAGLYYIGRLPDEDIDRIAVVGSRRCSSYGRAAAHMLAKKLAEVNICIVSGMAEGVDTAAHKGALEGAGHTVAVLGSGLKRCFPASNRKLMKEIEQKGCVITEYPPDMQPLPYNFPARNRIIAGLCSAVLVVEAGAKSGSLITADIALDEGREVFAVPGKITSKLSDGTNELIKQGCSLVTDYSDILFELGIAYSEEEKNKFLQKSRVGLETEQKKVYDCIGAAPVSIDEILQNLQMPAAQLYSTLTILEVKGFIKKLPDGYVKER